MKRYTATCLVSSLGAHGELRSQEVSSTIVTSSRATFLDFLARAAANAGEFVIADGWNRGEISFTIEIKDEL